MLNYVWIGLVVIGVLTAAGNDIYDSASNRYHNGTDFELQYDSTAGGEVVFTKNYFAKFYGISIASSDTLRFPAVLQGNSDTNNDRRLRSAPLENNRQNRRR